jgi:hypothetical protein
MDQFARWITNADTKAGLLAAALAILTGWVAQRMGTVVHRLPPGSLVEWIVLLGLLTSAAAIVLSTAFLVCAVIPRVHEPRLFSRYSWPSVAGASVADLVLTERRSEREESWQTAHILASIARRKFRHVRRAFLWWTLGTLSFLLAGMGSLSH